MESRLTTVTTGLRWVTRPASTLPRHRTVRRRGPGPWPVSCFLTIRQTLSAKSAEQDAQFVAGNEGDFVRGNVSVTIPGVSVHDFPSVDVEFSNIVNDRTGARRSDMRWEGVEMVDGVFGSAGDFSSSRDAGFFPTVGGRIFEGEGVLFGQFYGSDHEEVGGLFMRDGLGGTFGARRDEG